MYPYPPPLKPASLPAKLLTYAILIIIGIWFASIIPSIVRGFKPHPLTASPLTIPLAPLGHPSPLIATQGYSLGGKDPDRVYHIRSASPAEAARTVDRITTAYRRNHFTITTTPGFSEPELTLDPIMRQRLNQHVPWWQPATLPSPQTTEILSPNKDQGLYLWHSPTSSDIYLYLWSA